MIIDLPRFLTTEAPTWHELAAILDRLERDPDQRLALGAARRFHFLYQKTAADLTQLATFASEPETRRYLEALVARAYAEIHAGRERGEPFRVGDALLRAFPAAFQRHYRAFGTSLAVTLVGVGFGAMAVTFDPAAKVALMPFPQLMISPQERVAREEGAKKDPLLDHRATFSGELMTHNIQVSITTLALGLTYGVGTMVYLFFNGVILGAVAADYVLAGKTVFLCGWLLPHGVIEIPAILVAGQAGLVIGQALIGWGNRQPLGARFRAVREDLLLLTLGFAVMLVWAGLVESFLSQYHEPVIPYALKIAFGLLELAALIFYLTRRPSPADPEAKK